ncbi:MAG TPA: DNA methyltransferase [Tepidisphaeraceae bacterium]|nr:DNA methyltransferase [Tepidisphaeraceae bacterium]
MGRVLQCTSAGTVCGNRHRTAIRGNNLKAKPSISCARSVPRAGWVVDPFLGSGTTALVTRRLGLRCVGIDNDPVAFAGAVNRRQKGVDWQMKIDDARTKLASVYPKIKV